MQDTHAGRYGTEREVYQIKLKPKSVNVAAKGRKQN